jgi:prolyl-tRNA synthetase
VTRTLQASVEQSHDKDGIIWPAPIAPFHVHICLLDPSEAKAQQVCDKLTAQLEKHNVEVFVDDREERPGIKFKDADLLGLPVRVNIGKRGLENNELEVVSRKTKEVKKVSPENTSAAILEMLGSLR